MNCENWKIIPEEEIESLIDEIIKELEGRPDDGIWNVYFNEAKGATCVVWKDGMKTVVKCQPGDIFSKETGLAMCYMKRFFNNRSCFNETLKKYCYD